MNIFKKNLNKEYVFINKFLDDNQVNLILNLLDLSTFEKAKFYNQGRVNKELFLNNDLVKNIILNKIQQINKKYNFSEILISEPQEFYLYEKGNYILPHKDSSEELEKNIFSNYTAIIYLNDNFIGGNTIFNNTKLTIKPIKGGLLLFKHTLMHEAEEIKEGYKIIYRANWYIKN